MSRTRLTPALRQQVAEKSGYRCSYCLTTEEIAGARFTIDHIVPESLGGATIPDNLCLACWQCNLIKGNRIAAVDPRTGETVRLFHPNNQNWTDYFQWHAGDLLIIGLTPRGRATVTALKLNRPVLINARRLWIEAGWHPPQD